MRLDFPAYLEAKLPLDERSLNPEVRAVFHSALRGRISARVLDIGCGTGASLRRLMTAELVGSLQLTGVDREAELLVEASSRLTHELEMAEFEVACSPRGVEARRYRQAIDLRFVSADLADFRPEQSGHYDAVIAHALMDLLPAAEMARRIRDWLGPAGLFYATLNYDAGTTLFPLDTDPAFEAGILAHYDASMERNLDGRPCGGAQSGRRLHAALLEAGFEMLAYGSSDWNITPYRGAYRDADALCLRALLDMIHGEARQSGPLEIEALDGWWRRRQDQIERRELGLIIHQIDLLAQRTVDVPIVMPGA